MSADQGLPPGAYPWAFVDEIERAVGSYDVLIALIGRQWLDVVDGADHRRLDDPSDFVRLEIATALERNIRVIPALVQGAPYAGYPSPPRDPAPGWPT